MGRSFRAHAGAVGAGDCLSAREVAGVALADRVERSASCPDDVIEDGDTEDASRVREPLRDVEVLATRSRVAARVVVSDQERAGADCDGGLEDLTGVDERGGCGSNRDDAVRDRSMTSIEVDRHEVLARVVVDPAA